MNNDKLPENRECKSRSVINTRKRISEKLIVAFTNSIVLILDFYILVITKPLVSCFGLECLDFGEAHNLDRLPGSLGADYKYLQARKIPHKLHFTSQTIPDCIR